MDNKNLKIMAVVSVIVSILAVIIAIVSVLDDKPSEEEILLQKQIDILEEELLYEKSEEPDLIENPSLGELSAAEIAERNAVHNEIQGVNKQVIKMQKEKELAAQKKLEEQKKAAEAKLLEQQRLAEKKKTESQQPVVTPTPVVVEPKPVVPVVPDIPKQKSGTVKINTKQSPLTLRSGTTTKSTALDAIPKGTEVEYGQTKQAEGHTWYEVKYGDKTGWVRGDYVLEE